MKKSVMQCSVSREVCTYGTVRTNDPSFKDQTDTNPPRDPVAIKSPNPRSKKQAVISEIIKIQRCDIKYTDALTSNK